MVSKGLTKWRRKCCSSGIISDVWLEENAEDENDDEDGESSTPSHCLPLLPAKTS